MIDTAILSSDSAAAFLATEEARVALYSVLPAGWCVSALIVEVSDSTYRQ